jgi:dihydrofolate synthase / folylpolyglutamate synthase
LSDFDAISFINSSKQYGSRLGLERITRLCHLIGDPQDKLGIVHIAGTNGKGSTSAMVASILSAVGYKTGLYTSPYIEDVCECMQIGQRHITSAEFAATAAVIREKAEPMTLEGDPATEFELETAIAFLWFAQSGCKLAVIETGLGGRLDATNVIGGPLVSVITSISMDHMQLLGDTIEKIATEKCGIIKPNGVTVSYPLQCADAYNVISAFAAKQNNVLLTPDATKIIEVGAGLDGTDIIYRGIPLHIPLIGRQQIYNAVTAVETALELREHSGLAITDDNITDGIGLVKMPLRQELFCRRPIVLLDGAHNPDGLEALADTIKTHLNGRRLAVVMGMLADKEYEKSISLIAPLCSRFIAALPSSRRALASDAAALVAGGYSADVSANDNLTEALAEAIRFAGPDGAVVVCGSLYLAAPACTVLRANPGLLRGSL